MIFLSFAAPLLAQPVRGTAGDLWADLVLGQPNFGSLSYNQVTASGIFLPGGIAADPNPTHHRLYVWDSGTAVSWVSAIPPTSFLTSQLALQVMPPTSS